MASPRHAHEEGEGEDWSEGVGLGASESFYLDSQASADVCGFTASLAGGF